MLVMILTNSGLAVRKGRSPLLWGFITLLAFIVLYVLLGTIYVLMTYKGAFTPENIEPLKQYMQTFQKDTSKALLLAMFGVGGGLLVRYRLTRYPDKSTRGDEPQDLV